MKAKHYLSLSLLCALFIMAAWISLERRQSKLSSALAAPLSLEDHRPISQTLNWNIVTVDNVGEVGQFTSLALDGSGNPHISYYDLTNQDLKYARWTGSSWQIQTVDSAGDVGANTSLALDSNGNPHISYSDTTNGNLKYARWTGSEWQIQIVENVGGSTPTSLALDNNDNPHISYIRDYSFPSSNQLKYAYWTGSNWNIQVVDNDVGNLGSSSSIALDSSGNPHISYEYANFVQPSTFVMRLRYARWTGSNWQTSLVDSTGRVGQYCSIALDNSGNPHISYIDATNGNLKYARWTGSSWQTQTVGSVGSWPEGTSIVVDTSGLPHVSYYDSNLSVLKYAHWTGINWQIHTVDSGNAGSFSSLAIDSLGNLHISYYESDNGDLKYARSSSPAPTNKFIYLPLSLKDYQLPFPGTPTATPTLSGPTSTPTPTNTPTPTPTSTPTPTFTPTPGGPTPTPPPCGISNCDFEQGATIWSEYSQNGFPVIMHANDLPVPPHSGSWAAWLGGCHDEIAYIQQSVFVPAERPYLGYWHWIDSQDYCGYDFAYVLINNNIVHQYDLCYDNYTNGWVQHAVDLSTYAGQTVQLQVRVETDSTLYSSLFLDDFAFQSTLSVASQPVSVYRSGDVIISRR